MRTRKATTLVLLLGWFLFAGAAQTRASQSVSDATTTLKVKLVLLDKLGTDSLHIDVDYVSGAVALKGTVKKRETKELASTVVKSVTGVSSVDNNLKVEAIAKDPNQAGAMVGEAEAEVKDAVLETKIRLELIDKLGSDGFKVGTEAASGVVTLEFDSAWPNTRRQEAMAAVRGVDGVKKVVTIDKKG